MEAESTAPFQVYWLLLAISQDRPKNTYVAELRDQCERAALEGYWVWLSICCSRHCIIQLGLAGSKIVLLCCSARLKFGASDVYTTPPPGQDTKQLCCDWIAPLRQGGFSLMCKCFPLSKRTIAPCCEAHADGMTECIPP